MEKRKKAGDGKETKPEKMAEVAKTENTEDMMFETVSADFDPIAEFQRQTLERMKETETEKADNVEEPEAVPPSSPQPSLSKPRRGRRPKERRVADATMEIRFNTDFVTKTMVSAYMLYAGRTVTREEFFRDALHEYVKRHNPELYGKLKDIAEMVRPQ